MKSLVNLQIFVQVARLRSFSGAALSLGLSASAVSKAVQRLEDELQLKLLHRTTRKLSLTDDGENLFLRARDLLEELEHFEAELGRSQTELRGRLRLNVPATLGRNVLVGPVTRFLACHPKLKVEMRLDDRIVDLAEEGVDVAVRTGQLSDSSQLIVTGFFRYQTILCASPRLLEGWGRPANLEQLLQMPCLGFAFRAAGRSRSWRLMVDGELGTVPVSPRFVVEDLSALALACCEGAGVALLPSWSCLEAVRSGQLVELLAEFRPPATQVWLAYHDRRHPALKIRRFVEDMKALGQDLTRRYTLVDL